MFKFERKQTVGPGVAPMTADAIEAWLVNRLGEYLQIPSEEINVDEPFSNYGLDSMAAVKLAAELEDIAGRQLSPTLVWDYPTVRAVVQHVTSGKERPAGDLQQAEALKS